MKVELTSLRGVALHDAIVHVDPRGTFAKLRECDGDPIPVDQVCVSSNVKAGTIRGLHIQLPPHEEEKLVWCTAGKIFDVLVDTRPGEPTYGRWSAVELASDIPQLLQVPPGVAHGYQTRTNGATVAYLIVGKWAPTEARTIAWNDPTLRIDWPEAVTEISDGDRGGSPWPLS
jgi:dTDP-4-dehydrorhamnose 3,5-epimerase